MNEGIRILDKNLMILASAGSGKTYQLGNRVIGLAGVHGVDPERMVALTFTRKAAGEFADEVLRKLALCARDRAKAAEVAAQIGAEGIDFPAVLEKVAKALPRFRLGTIDSFFARVVRCFPHELGLAGGHFELIEGPRLEAAHEDILSTLLGSVAGDGSAQEFLHAFRRAVAGREPQRVAEELRGFLDTWHGLWKAGLPAAERGAGAFGALPAIEDWEGRKRGMVEAIRGTCQANCEEDLLDLFEAHTIGSGVLGKAGVLFERIAGQVPGSGCIVVNYKGKDIEFTAARSAAWRELFLLCAGCELAAAVARTAAVREVVECYDRECARRLRAKGLLGFDDVKLLMGAWSRSEEARLRREQVDFRLDARYDHWLLDEFQDTSVAEWTGLEPLLDEAASDAGGSLFVVGDTKQAIYAFKGGDVTLFEQVRARYGGGMTVATMPRSWRSCRAVLDLVNRVCGDLGTIGDLLGAGVAARWQWEDHEAARASLTGEARVETLDAGGDPLVRTVEILKGWGVGERAMTCGVLVRTNREVRLMAEHLRGAGFDVIEEGSRQPACDNLPGVALHHLLRWLADPADGFAREVVAMSPLERVLHERHGEAWQARWEGLAECVMEAGFAVAIEQLVEPLWSGWSVFNRRRTGDVIGLLAAYDAEGGASAREAARRLERFEVPQAPGVAAVQVMTVHKAKGLGFDAVVIPEVSGDKVPNFAHYEVAKGDGWALQSPAGWVRELVPELRRAQERWTAGQRHDAMCYLYVALTRAKRGLHVLLPAPAKSAKDAESRASLANWVTRSCGAGFQSGDAAWFGDIGPREPVPQPREIRLGRAVPRRSRRTPSSAKAKVGGPRVPVSRGGMEFGTAVHAAFERVGWVDDGLEVLGVDEPAAVARRCLAEPSVREWFERKEGREVFREQAVEAIHGGAWVSGVIDRLVIDRDAAGAVVSATVIDFKTDAVEDVAVLRERYAGQMAAYREIVATALGVSAVTCLLVSTRLRQVVECAPACGLSPCGTGAKGPINERAADRSNSGESK